MHATHTHRRSGHRPEFALVPVLGRLKDFSRILSLSTYKIVPTHTTWHTQHGIIKKILIASFWSVRYCCLTSSPPVTADKSLWPGKQLASYYWGPHQTTFAVLKTYLSSSQKKWESNTRIHHWAINATASQVVIAFVERLLVPSLPSSRCLYRWEVDILSWWWRLTVS